MLVTIGVAVVLFVSTNIDDVFLLVALFANPAFKTRQVVIGQLVGIGALIALSLIASTLSLVMSEQYLGLLGLVPFGLGAFQLIGVLRGSEDDDDDDEAPVGGHSRVLAVALVTIANGGDNVGAYVPVFAVSSVGELIATVVVFLVMTAGLLLLGYALVSHPKIGPTVRRFARPLTPVVLMAVGVWIVIEAESYRLVTG